MHVKIPYGHDTRLVDIPDGWVGNRILRAPRANALGNPAEALDTALRKPVGSLALHEILRSAKSLCIAVDETSRAAPLHVILPALLYWIETKARMQPKAIRLLLIEPQSHWTPSDQSQASLDLGTLGGCKVTVHGVHDNQQCSQAGMLADGMPVALNRTWLSAEPRIVVSLVEPRHLWGYSGGGASILPGLAGANTRSRYLEDPNRLAQPSAVAGNLRDNPFYHLSLEAMNLAPPAFALHFVLNRDGQIAAFFAGDPLQSHIAAVQFHREHLEPVLNEPMDILLTGAGGFPCDASLADTIRSLVSGSRLLKPEGTLVVLSECSKGIGPTGFENVLRTAKSPTRYFELAAREEFHSPFLWLTHPFYRVLQRHEVLIHCDGVSEDDLWAVGLTPVPDPMEAVRLAMETHGQDCKIAVIPEGWRTVGRLREDATVAADG